MIAYYYIPSSKEYPMKSKGDLRSDDPSLARD